MTVIDKGKWEARCWGRARAAASGQTAQRGCGQTMSEEQEPLREPRGPREGLFPPSHARVLSRRVTWSGRSPHCPRGGCSPAGSDGGRQ